MEKGQWLLCPPDQKAADEGACHEMYFGLSRCGAVTHPLAWWKTELTRPASPFPNTAWQMLQC
jgi:hypothetical protein